MSSLHATAHPGDHSAIEIRHIGLADLRTALQRGLDDFWAMPTHIVFLALIYPIAGLFLARLTYTYNILPLLFPLMAGFALIVWGYGQARQQPARCRRCLSGWFSALVPAAGSSQRFARRVCSDQPFAHSVIKMGSNAVRVSHAGRVGTRLTLRPFPRWSTGCSRCSKQAHQLHQR